MLFSFLFTSKGELFVRFRDFYTIIPKQDEPVCNCEAREPGMSKATKQRIVQETGDHYKVLEEQQGVKNYYDDGHSSTTIQQQHPPAKVYGESWSDAMRQPVVENSFVEVD